MNKKSEKGGLVFSTDKHYLEEQLNAAREAPIETLPPDRQRLAVRRDTSGRKGKVVTVVSGFSGTEEDAGALSKKLKQSLGIGGSAKDGEILLQGDVTEKAAALLVSLGYIRTKKQ